MALIGVTGGDNSWPPVTSSQGGNVHRYDVIVNGIETTLLLSDSDAAQRGLTKKAAPAAPDADAKAAKAPANKNRKTANKSTEAADKAADDVTGGDE